MATSLEVAEAEPPGGASPLRIGAIVLRSIFAALFAFAIFLPFVPISGPLSADDLLPLAGAFLGIAAVAFSEKELRLDATAIGFALLAVLTILSSAANARELPEFGRYLGRSLGRTLFYFSVAMTARSLLDHPRIQRIAIWLVVSAATLESVFSIWAVSARYYGPYGIGVSDFGGWSVLKGGVRAQGTFSGALTANDFASASANFLAAYLVMSIPLTVGLALYEKRPRIQMLIFGSAMIQAVALYLTYTRAALGALGITILALGFLLERKKAAIGILVAVIAITFAIPAMRAKIMDEGNDRKALYFASAEITRDHALIGVGDGAYESQLFANRRYFNTPYGSAETTSHNSILLTAANHGLAGGFAQLIIYVLLALVALRSMKRTEGRERFLAAGLAAALFGYLSQDQLNNLAYVPKVATQMWFFFGLLTAMATTTAPAGNPPAARS